MLDRIEVVRVLDELWVYLGVLNDVEAQEDEGTDLGFE